MALWSLYPSPPLTDELGDYDNTFEVEYEAEGDLHCTVDIDLENGVDACVRRHCDL